MRYSCEPQRNQNPFNQLFSRKGGSEGNVVVGPNMYQEPSNKELYDPRERDISFDQNLFNDEINNPYHSNIKLDHILGVTSRIVPDAPRPPPRPDDDFGGYPSI